MQLTVELRHHFKKELFEKIKVDNFMEVKDKEKCLRDGWSDDDILV